MDTHYFNNITYIANTFFPKNIENTFIDTYIEKTLNIYFNIH